MSPPKVKNVSKGNREVDGYEYFSDWISDVENNIYIGQNASKYAQCPMPESKWVFPFVVFDSVGSSKSWIMKEMLSIYEKYVRGNNYLMKSLPELKGKNLGCWCCASDFCHGSVLVKLYQDNCEKSSVPAEKKKNKLV